MSKEIERKWVCTLTDELRSVILDPYEVHEIKDYYFNDYTRLRKIDKEFYITIKSSGNKIRDEFEFKIDKNQINFITTPRLIKKRIIYPYKNHKFEINVFKDILMKRNDSSYTNLVLAELELNSENEQIELPSFISPKKEVTNNSDFYGYNLYKRVNHNYGNDIVVVIKERENVGTRKDK